MLFNSYEFLFIFLPLALIGFYLLSGQKSRTWFLILASVVFYAYWDYRYLILIFVSVVMNFTIANNLSNRPRKYILTIGVSLNLLILGYYKYYNFFLSTLNQVTDTNYVISHIVLPLGISFYTFEQIAHLVESYRQKSLKSTFAEYLFFVIFFPHLIAGPVVEHNDLVSEVRKDRTNELFYFLGLGLTIFAVGLCKKAYIADSLAKHATLAYGMLDSGQIISNRDAWLGSLSYTFQLYFDFSGYTDMAIGLGYMFGIKLPQNFNSPYKATSISDFWRRWHMTLSNFLKNYLYFALGGNRLGKVRTYINLFLTMVIGGLWHGAGWTFVIWGTVHGLALIINHLYNQFYPNKKFPKMFGIALTFIVVHLAWVYFRSKDFTTAHAMMSCLFDLSLNLKSYVNTGRAIPMLVLAATIAWIFPSTFDFLIKNNQWGKYKFSFKLRYAFWFGLLFFIGISHMAGDNEFLYFQF